MDTWPLLAGGQRCCGRRSADVCLSPCSALWGLGHLCGRLHPSAQAWASAGVSGHGHPGQQDRGPGLSVPSLGPTHFRRSQLWVADHPACGLKGHRPCRSPRTTGLPGFWSPGVVAFPARGAGLCPVTIIFRQQETNTPGRQASLGAAWAKGTLRSARASGGVRPPSSRPGCGRGTSRPLRVRHPASLRDWNRTGARGSEIHGQTHCPRRAPGHASACLVTWTFPVSSSHFPWPPCSSRTCLWPPSGCVPLW